MKKTKTHLVRTFAATLVIALMMINIQVDVEPPYSIDSVTFTVNEAKADMHLDMEVAYRTCWNTNQYIRRCVVGEYVCEDEETC